MAYSTRCLKFVVLTFVVVFAVSNGFSFFFTGKLFSVWRRKDKLSLFAVIYFSSSIRVYERSCVSNMTENSYLQGTIVDVK